MPTALVTGASSGIGAELARSLARRDHDLILAARRADALEVLATELRAEHGRAVTVTPADLSTDEGPPALLDAVLGAGLQVDVLVNNAGFATHGPFARIDLETELAELRLNVVALTWLAKALLPGMLERGRGGILNVASTAAFQPGPGMAVYYASKAYVLHLSEALSEEVRGSGVTVTALCPGPTETGFQRRAGLQGTRLERRRGIFQDASTVAEQGVRAFERGQRVFVPGTANRLGTIVARLVPRAWTARGVAWAHARDERD